MEDRMKLSKLTALLLLCLPLSGIADYQYQSQFGSRGSTTGRFDGPRGVAIDNVGDIVVTESGNHRVQICTDTGTCTAWGSFGTLSDQFDRPRGVGVDSEDRIFVADRGNDRIERCNASGSCGDFGGSA